MKFSTFTGGLGACAVALSLYGGSLPAGIQKLVDTTSTFVVKIVKHDESARNELKAAILKKERDGTLIVTMNENETQTVRRVREIQIAIKSLVFLGIPVGPRATFPAVFRKGGEERLVHITCSMKGEGEKELKCSI